jgi:hypothetical protein
MSHRIRIIDTNGTVTTLAGTDETGDTDGPLAAARFNTPQSPVFDSHGNAYVADLANHRVRKISVDGIVSTFAGSTEGYRNGVGANAQFHTVQTVCIDANDNLYVADWDNICIRKITPDGEVTLFAGQPGIRGGQDGPRLEATFETPDQMAFAPNGNMFITDWANGTLRVIDTNGIVSTFARGITYAHRLIVDTKTNIYATWGVPGPLTYLRKYRPDASIAWTVGGTYGFQDGPIEQAQFAFAFSPALLPNGDILITDQINHRIRRIEMSVAALLKISGEAIFTNSTTVTITTLATEADVRFTLDGSEPTINATAYSHPFMIEATTTVKARLFVNGTPVSDVVSAKFTAAEVAPVIRHQPNSIIGEVGSTVAFTIDATGTAPLSFQWRFKEEYLPDQTRATLVLSNVQSSQAGDYTVVVTNSFGAVTSEVATLTVILGPSRLRVVNVDAAPGAAVNVPIELQARGEENALGFTLQFDPSLLTAVSVSLGRGAPDTAALIANLNEADSGRIGVLLALPSDETFDPGSHEVVVVNLQAAVITHATSTFIFFRDEPILRQVSDSRAHPLPAEYQAGRVNIDRAPLEGDVGPRPHGDSHLSVIDWVQLGRFVTALDPVTPEEFQRADCAPRSTLGNGVISVADWVQAGRYAAGVDPLTTAGGPDAPVVLAGRPRGGVVNAAPARTLGLPSVKGVPGQRLTLPVRVNAQGDENAFGFTLVFDSSRLTFRSVSRAAATGLAALNVNSNGAPSGIVGLALALPTGMKLASGSQEIVSLVFDAAQNATGTVAVAFNDWLVLREVSDPAAIAVPAAYNNGWVSFETTPLVRPPLSVERFHGGLLLSWPDSADGFELESVAALGGTWTQVDSVPMQIAGRKMVVMPPSGTSGYFRLRRPCCE